MVKDRDILINYIRQTLKGILTIKIVIIYFFCISLINITSIINISKKFENANCWDGFFYIVENKFYYYFIFLGLFLIILIKICTEYKSNTMIITKIRNKHIWLHSKLISVIIFSFFYTTINFLVIFLISLYILSFESRFSIEAINSNSLLYHTHHYAMNLSIEVSILFLYIKHIFGVVFIGLIYLMSYISIKNRKTIYATFICIIYFVISYNWNLHVFIPCFSVSPRSIFLYRKAFDFKTFIVNDNIPLIITMCIFYIIMLLKVSNLEFTE